MTDHEMLLSLKKCQKLCLKVSGKNGIQRLKQKLIDSREDVDEFTSAGSNQSLLETVSGSALSLPILLDGLQEVMSTVIKGLSSFIKPPAPFSSAQPQ